MVVAACAILWALVAVAFVAHTAERRRAARVAASFAGVEAIEMGLSDIGSQPWSPVRHAFTICAVVLVPLGAAALLSLTLPRRRGRGRAPRRASRG